MARCTISGCKAKSEPQRSCYLCGLTFCEIHNLPEDHKCKGLKPKSESMDSVTQEICPRCGSHNLAEGYWESYEYTPISNDKVDWGMRNLWWLGALDFFAFPSPTERIVKRWDGFYLRRSIGGKDIYCRKCGSGLRPYDCSRKEVYYCELEDLVSDTSDWLVEKNIGSLVVRDKVGRNVGMLTDALILKAISSGTDIGKFKVKELNLEPFVTAPKDIGLEEAMEILKRSLSSRIALLDDKGKIAGILKEKNLKRFGK
jgi:hypothetical protein